MQYYITKFKFKIGIVNYPTGHAQTEHQHDNARNQPIDLYFLL